MNGEEQQIQRDIQRDGTNVEKRERVILREGEGKRETKRGEREGEIEVGVEMKIRVYI